MAPSDYKNDSTDIPLHLPACPILSVRAHRVSWMNEEGEIEILSLSEGGRKLAQNDRATIVLHALATARRLKCGPFAKLDLLELIAFVHPAQFCLPTVAGVAAFLKLAPLTSFEDEAVRLFEAVQTLLQYMRDHHGGDEKLIALVWAMKAGGWGWAPYVLHALQADPETMPHSGTLLRSLQVWNGLKEWVEFAPRPAADHFPVEAVEARARLDQLLGKNAEERAEQKQYAEAMCETFKASEQTGKPHISLIEAGTGIGKTLGYIAPAHVWSQKNDGAVWISTYTRNLQRQLDGELDRVFEDPREKKQKVVIRKGRENYFCLLNFEESVNRLRIQQDDAVALGLMARWVSKTRDGDMIGGDFPAWLKELLGSRLTLDLTDTRGECIYSSCSHYSKCFIEKSVRRSRRADLVVANHALVMIQASMGGTDEALLPSRYIFDEGHHVFDAADQAFSAHLSAREGADLRRWILGAEEKNRSRSRGLKKRIEDLIFDGETSEVLENVLVGARHLPAPGWTQRLRASEPFGDFEKFLHLVHRQVYARDRSEQSGGFNLETPTQPLIDGMANVAARLSESLSELQHPMQSLTARLVSLLDEEADELDSPTRQRIEAMCASLERRGINQVMNWRAMLQSLQTDPPAQFSDWFGVDRADGFDVDVGMHRHHIDPTLPFIEEVVEKAHGVAITSATLRDGTTDETAAWAGAFARTGMGHSASVPFSLSIKSPFDYAKQTRVFVVNDIDKGHIDHLASAYRELFLAAGGGGLGLFTSISRLKAVHQKISEPLEQAGLEILSQHIDTMDVGTLIDIFRAEASSCLLGTDAVRDGVDVPGDSLHLIVFDRVPWARPTLLHKARKRHFSAQNYDEMIARFRLKQAYGRLIRRKTDRGVFVILDRQTPTRLLNAFPEGVEAVRTGLADVIKETQDFLIKD